MLPALSRQQSGPVQLRPSLGADARLVQRAVVVGEQERLQGGVAAQVLQPEASHDGPVEDGHGLVLLVGWGVEVERLQHGVDQRLDLELHLQGVI